MPPIGGGLARARVKNHRLIESWHRRAKTAQARSTDDLNAIPLVRRHYKQSKIA